MQALTRENLFRLPERWSFTLSPDGKKLAYVESGRRLMLEDRELTAFETPEITHLHWTPDGQHLLFLHDGDLYAVDVATAERRCLAKAPVKIFTNTIIGKGHPFYDLYKLNPKTLELIPYYKNEHYCDFLFDERGEIGLSVALNDDRTVTLAEFNLTFTPAEAFHTEWLSYNENSLYLLDNRTTDTTALTQVFRDGREPLVLAHDPTSDIDEVLFVGGKPVAVAFYTTSKSWQVLDPCFEADFERLIEGLGLDFSIIQKAQAELVWLIKRNVPEGISFWLYDRWRKQLTPLYNYPDIENLQPMQPLAITTSDGLELTCYLTLPKGLSPYPLVVVPHGGPFKVRDRYEFSAQHQWLASMGYAALSVNFRGSSGFGKAFVNAATGEWGRKMHQDIVDAVSWCIDAKIADPRKVALFGSSYGGYAALAGLAFTPKLFTCAVAICGPSNLKTVLTNAYPFWETGVRFSHKTLLFTKNGFLTMIGGNPANPQEHPFLESRSPLFHADMIEKPLLLVHGGLDTIVRADESEQIFTRLKELGREVHYIYFPDEGHAIVHPANVAHYLTEAEKFFAAHLLQV